MWLETLASHYNCTAVMILLNRLWAERLERCYLIQEALVFNDSNIIQLSVVERRYTTHGSKRTQIATDLYSDCRNQATKERSRILNSTLRGLPWCWLNNPFLREVGGGWVIGGLPAPPIRTLFPMETPALLQAWTATAKGSIIAPASKLTLSGSLSIEHNTGQSINIIYHFADILIQ